MRIGIPREITDQEYRVSVTPAGVEALVTAGHAVLVESGAGEGSGFGDRQYRGVGATIVTSHAEAFERVDTVVKVKEPLPPEYGLMREGLVLFTFLHLAADEPLTKVLLEKKVTAIAYETVELPDGSLPLLTPMSEVAGRMSIQVAAHYLEKRNGGRGKLLGGVPGVPPARVVILGAGVAGSNAAEMALGLGAQVVLINRGIDRLRSVSGLLRGNLITLASNHYNISEALRDADVLVCAVLVTGAKAPVLVNREMVRSMGPGAVVVDISVDQGGCIETTRPTTHSSPTYKVDGVVHYTVANIPGAVPATSTLALSNVTLPYVLRLANSGFARAVRDDAALARGVNCCGGHVTHPAVARSFGLPYSPLEQVFV